MGSVGLFKPQLLRSPCAPANSGLILTPMPGREGLRCTHLLPGGGNPSLTVGALIGVFPMLVPRARGRRRGIGATDSVRDARRSAMRERADRIGARLRGLSRTVQVTRKWYVRTPNSGDSLEFNNTLLLQSGGLSTRPGFSKIDHRLGANARQVKESRFRRLRSAIEVRVTVRNSRNRNDMLLLLLWLWYPSPAGSLSRPVHVRAARFPNCRPGSVSAARAGSHNAHIS